MLRRIFWAHLGEISSKHKVGVNLNGEWESRYFKARGMEFQFRFVSTENRSFEHRIQNTNEYIFAISVSFLFWGRRKELSPKVEKLNFFTMAGSQSKVEVLNSFFWEVGRELLPKVQNHFSGNRGKLRAKIQELNSFWVRRSRSKVDKFNSFGEGELHLNVQEMNFFLGISSRESHPEVEKLNSFWVERSQSKWIHSRGERIASQSSRSFLRRKGKLHS